MRIKVKVKYRLLLLCLLTTTAFSQTQKFRYHADIDKIDSAGFYRINLRPKLIAKCKSDLSDLRIADQKGNYIPFVIAGQLPPGKQTDFVEFPHIININKADTVTSFVVENKDHLSVRSLWLKLKNTSVIRTISLTGSDDLNRWFAIRENMSLEQSDNNTTDSYLLSISFPASTYRYFKILVDDKHKNPINILQAGVFMEHAQPVKFVSVPDPVIAQKDSAKTTHLSLRFDDAYQLNKLHFTITDPKYFKRTVYIYALIQKERELIGEAELSSNKPTDLLISAKTQKIQLEINNEDNPPLVIKNISAYQVDQYIISYLEPGKAYQLLFSNTIAEAPVYDLKFFTDSINHPFKPIGHQEIVANKVDQDKPVVKGRNYAFIIWLAIVAALIILFALTWKMTTEVKKKFDNQ